MPVSDVGGRFTEPGLMRFLARCVALQVACHVLRVTCYLLRVTCYVLRVTCYVLRVTCYVLRVTCYVLRVTCYVFSSHVTRQVDAPAIAFAESITAPLQVLAPLNYNWFLVMFVDV